MEVFWETINQYIIGKRKNYSYNSYKDKYGLISPEDNSGEPLNIINNLGAWFGFRNDTYYKYLYITNGKYYYSYTPAVYWQNNSSTTTIKNTYTVYSRIKAQVIPVVYLKSNLVILSGQGTEESPYEIGVKQ